MVNLKDMLNTQNETSWFFCLFCSFVVQLQNSALPTNLGANLRRSTLSIEGSWEVEFSLLCVSRWPKKGLTCEVALPVTTEYTLNYRPPNSCTWSQDMGVHVLPLFGNIPLVVPWQVVPLELPFWHYKEGAIVMVGVGCLLYIHSKSVKSAMKQRTWY